MKKRMMKLLLEYLKDSKRSDREIAEVLGVSQPTVTRMRQRLVKACMHSVRFFQTVQELTHLNVSVLFIISSNHYHIMHHFKLY